MNDLLAEIAEMPDSVLQSIVWMAEDAGMELPSLPEVFVTRLEEIQPGKCFATDKALVDYLGHTDLEQALLAGIWPVGGLAFRLSASGRWLYWRYLLVGRVNLIQINLRMLLTSEDGIGVAVPASSANLLLSRYLQNEITLSRYLAEGQTDPNEVAQIIRFENIDAGNPREVHQTWSANGGLSAPRHRSEVFNNFPITELAPEEMLLRL